MNDLMRLIKINLLVIFLTGMFSAREMMAEGIVFDMKGAREWVDDSALDIIEGIWEFPEDETSVIIKKSAWDKYGYDILIVASPDCRLNPGDKIGTLKRSASDNKLKLSLFTRRNRNIFTDTRECLAELNPDATSILFQPRKLKFSLRSISFLSGFWGRLNVKVDNPLEKLHEGLIRIYPPQPGVADSFNYPYYL